MPKCIQCGVHLDEPLSVFNFYRVPQRLCQPCLQMWESVRLIKDEQRCPKCLNDNNNKEGKCLDCQFLAKNFTLMDQLYCDYQYTGIMREIIHQYKLMRDYYLAEVLASQLQLPQTTYDLIVPIPSPLARDKLRTFNPVATVLEKMGVNYADILGTELRPKQSKLGKVERAKAMNPFFIKEDIDLTGKEILLVDDIYTTGLTIHHTGCKLYDKNVRKFKVFTFSR
ncbi:ComF family protein [Staphylococcus borealis]|uniref:ComF family protein n=1 Tax=Staphylococcus borealis TaxID=2742203 RepID=UPI0025A1A0EE|nr:ComF family protein [Staphylococcus borealis]MDM7863786.1 ComF family protein [Staphylococcus borealis]